MNNIIERRGYNVAFFENYTENLWGKNPSEIAPDWGAQRVKGLSVIAIIKDIFGKMMPFKKKNRHVETSLIESFSYPKLGPGQLWETMAEEVEKMGGEIRKNTKVVQIELNKKQNAIQSVLVEQDGVQKKVCGRWTLFFSPAPIN